jgi:hypothetical protein
MRRAGQRRVVRRDSRPEGFLARRGLIVAAVGGAIVEAALWPAGQRRAPGRGPAVPGSRRAGMVAGRELRLVVSLTPFGGSGAHRSTACCGSGPASATATPGEPGRGTRSAGS